jgi:hypothetical protein
MSAAAHHQAFASRAVSTARDVELTHRALLLRAAGLNRADIDAATDRAPVICCARIETNALCSVERLRPARAEFPNRVETKRRR